MRWCGERDIGCVLGLARNARLVRARGRAMREARPVQRCTGHPARHYRDFTYRTRKPCSRRRRVVGKAEYLSNRDNSRFAATNLPPRRASARHISVTLFAWISQALQQAEPGREVDLQGHGDVLHEAFCECQYIAKRLLDHKQTLLFD